MADSAVEQIVGYVASLGPKSLNAALVHEAKRRVVDTIGCAIAAYDALPARIARAMAIPVADSFTARVIGSLVRTTPDLAAFANGVMVRYMDLNDDSGLPGSGAHPSDNLSAVLAVAEAVGASGIDFLLALTISYEIHCRIVDSAPFNIRGWDQPVAGGIAAAAACGKLLGLTRQQLREAISLAIIPNLSSYQTRIGHISMWKACAGANGGRQGVFAALLASKGMTGPAEPISGKFGLWALTMGERYEIKPFGTEGNNFFIARTTMKKHPVRNAGQLMVDTALDLIKKVKCQDIASLRICTFRASFKSKEVEWPETWSADSRETADHSVLFAVAATLLDGQLTPETYDRQRYLDSDVHDLIKRIKLEVTDVFDAEFTLGIRNCFIEATTKAGISFASHLRLSSDDAARGLSDTEIERKFGRLTQRALPEERSRGLLDVLWKLEDISNVGIILDHARLLHDETQFI